MLPLDICLSSIYYVYRAYNIRAFGTVVARMLCMHEVEGSNPSTSINFCLFELEHLTGLKRTQTAISVFCDPTHSMALKHDRQYGLFN